MDKRQKRIALTLAILAWLVLGFLLFAPAIVYGQGDETATPTNTQSWIQWPTTTPFPTRTPPGYGATALPACPPQSSLGEGTPWPGPDNLAFDWLRECSHCVVEATPTNAYQIIHPTATPEALEQGEYMLGPSFRLGDIETLLFPRLDDCQGDYCLNYPWKCGHFSRDYGAVFNTWPIYGSDDYYGCAARGYGFFDDTTYSSSVIDENWIGQWYSFTTPANAALVGFVIDVEDYRTKPAGWDDPACDVALWSVPSVIGGYAGTSYVREGHTVELGPVPWHGEAVYCVGNEQACEEVAPSGYVFVETDPLDTTVLYRNVLAKLGLKIGSDTAGACPFSTDDENANPHVQVWDVRPVLFGVGDTQLTPVPTFTPEGTPTTPVPTGPEVDITSCTKTGGTSGSSVALVDLADNHWRLDTYFPSGNFIEWQGKCAFEADAPMSSITLEYWRDPGHYVPARYWSSSECGNLGTTIQLPYPFINGVGGSKVAVQVEGQDRLRETWSFQTPLGGFDLSWEGAPMRNCPSTSAPSRIGYLNYRVYAVNGIEVPEVTPTPEPTSTPTMTPVSTPSGACSAFEWRNDEPVVDFDTGEDWIIPGSCYTVVPDEDFSIPSVDLLVWDFPGVDFELIGFELCIDWVRWPTARLLDINISLDWFLLPAVAFIVRRLLQL